MNAKKERFSRFVCAYMRIKYSIVIAKETSIAERINIYQYLFPVRNTSTPRFLIVPRFFIWASPCVAVRKLKFLASLKISALPAAVKVTLPATIPNLALRWPAIVTAPAFTPKLHHRP